MRASTVQPGWCWRIRFSGDKAGLQVLLETAPFRGWEAGVGIPGPTLICPVRPEFLSLLSPHPKPVLRPCFSILLLTVPGSRMAP